MSEETWFENGTQADAAKSSTQAVEELAAFFRGRRTASVMAAQVALAELERAKELERKLLAQAEQAEQQARKVEELVVAVHTAVHELLGTYIDEQAVETLFADWLRDPGADASRAA